jgi:hypothetical protein
VPRDWRISAPAPVATTGGATPKMNENEVIRIGRSRVRAACSAASPEVERPQHPGACYPPGVLCLGNQAYMPLYRAHMHLVKNRTAWKKALPQDRRTATSWRILAGRIARWLLLHLRDHERICALFENALS